MDRRDFLKKASALAACGAWSCAAQLPGPRKSGIVRMRTVCRTACGCGAMTPGCTTVQRGLQHPAERSDEHGGRHQVDGYPQRLRDSWGNSRPEVPGAVQDVKRIAWNLSGGSNESYHALKNYVFGLRETMPNLTAYCLISPICSTSRSRSKA